VRFGGIVLRNKKNFASSVNYGRILDALLEGGIFLDEVCLVPYDSPQLFTSEIKRLVREFEAIFVIADSGLLPYVRETVKMSCMGSFTGDSFFEGDTAVAVLSADTRGEEIVKTETIPAIDRIRRKRYSRMVFRAIGVPNDKLRQVIERARILSGEKIVYNTSEQFGDFRIELVYDSETPKMLADDVTRLFAAELSEYLYSVDDTSLPERLVQSLTLHKLKIATAESFTGGGVGKAIVEVSGASKVFFEGLNVYDSKAKEERLGVSAFSLSTHGAVSDEVAYEMAAGLMKQGHADVVIATTGLAGPKTDMSKKPVGLCYLAIGAKGRVRVYRYHLTGDREKITKTAINLALFRAYKEIN